MKKFLQQRNERLFNKLFEKQGVTIKELDVAKMTAWQALEEEELEEEENLEEVQGVVIDPETTQASTDDEEDEEVDDKYPVEENLQKGVLDKLEKSLKPMIQSLRSIDTPPELGEFLNTIISAIEGITKGGLNAAEVEKTLKGLIKQKPSADDREK